MLAVQQLLETFDVARSVYLIRSPKTDEVDGLLNDIAPRFAVIDRAHRVIAIRDPSEDIAIIIKRARQR